MFLKVTDLGLQVSELQNENEQLGRENGELKMAMNGRQGDSMIPPGGDQFKHGGQVHDLQDKVSTHHRNNHSRNDGPSSRILFC